MLQAGGRGGVSQRSKSIKDGGEGDESGRFAADSLIGGYSIHDDVAVFREYGNAARGEIGQSTWRCQRIYRSSKLSSGPSEI